MLPLSLAMWLIYAITSPANHSEAEDVFDFALKVEQGRFADQAGVNRLLALPAFGVAYHAAQTLGYNGRAFPFMIFINRLLAVVSLLLFWKLLGRMTSSSPTGIEDDAPSRDDPSAVFGPLSPVLCLAFSYGFWRYANEAETYVLAGVLVLGAWCLAVKGRWVWCTGVSALGILVHLLNLIPLLLAIPLYYLLSRAWKKAVLHGVLTGALVALAYGLCFSLLDWERLGAQYHTGEAGVGLGNLLRGGIAFGQCVVSGNFLFGFESFRALLARLFPSRMLGEEFYMAQHMPAWIKWAGTATLSLLAVCCAWVAAGMCKGAGSGSAALERGGKRRASPLGIAAWAWLLLYAVAVVRTESGSAELWILGLVPFWLVVASLLRGEGTAARWASWPMVVLLFLHNLVAGLLPVMPASSDYLQAKGKWLVENATARDLILTSYEPVLIFYLDYYSKAGLVDSGAVSLDGLNERLDSATGAVYAFSTFFHPQESMKVRIPAGYGRMSATGAALRPRFGKVVDDEFGGIYELNR